MSWNSHVGWTNNALNTAFRYHLEQYNGSTWNAIYSGTGSSYNLPNNLYGNQRFRVKIYSDDGKLPINYELYSNERKVYLGFDSSAFDTTLIPSAFNPSGINQIFKISNPAIAPGESEMTIYNRWGELLFKGDALLGWNGMDPSGNEVPQGAYIYLIQTSYRNKRTRYSGTLVLIK
jgi:gliding motility-associated-like protein